VDDGDQAQRLLGRAAISVSLPLPLAGEGWGEGNLNRFEQAVFVTEGLIVPESHDSPTFGTKECIAPSVAGAFRVLAAIQFDNESMLNRSKVDHVRAYRDLAAKFDAVETAVAQEEPQCALGIR
jgi:hypothetical protein